MLFIYNKESLELVAVVEDGEEMHYSEEEYIINNDVFYGL